MQYQNMNQVAQTAIKGRTSLLPAANVMSVQIDPSSIQTLYPASAVVLTTATANIPTVDKSTPAQNIFGFICWNPKKPNGWTANAKVEIALPGTIMEMESAASFNRGQILDQVVLNDQVQSHSGYNTPIGIALDNATGANQLVRVYIQIGLTV